MPVLKSGFFMIGFEISSKRGMRGAEIPIFSCYVMKETEKIFETWWFEQNWADGKCTATIPRYLYAPPELGYGLLNWPLSH
jgi:hypothetical protein